ncbi:MAG TPA: hypothetical protein VGJ93_04325 [Desulfuromonadaceae bacterium]|jgi:hypothetical protein
MTEKTEGCAACCNTENETVSIITELQGDVLKRFIRLRDDFKIAPTLPEVLSKTIDMGVLCIEDSHEYYASLYNGLSDAENEKLIYFRDELKIGATISDIMNKVVRAGIAHIEKNKGREE